MYPIKDGKPGPHFVKVLGTLAMHKGGLVLGILTLQGKITGYKTR